MTRTNQPTHQSLASKPYNLGFSLLELIIALAIFSVIMLTLSQSIQITRKAYDNLSKSQQQSVSLLRAIELISQDIRQSKRNSCQASFNHNWLTSTNVIGENNEHSFAHISIKYTDKKIMPLMDIDKKYANQSWLLHVNNCHSTSQIIPNLLTDVQKSTFKDYYASRIHDIHYFVEEKGQTWVLYRQQRSLGNGLYSRPILKNISQFSVMAFTINGAIPNNEDIDWQEVIGVLVKLSIIDSDHDSDMRSTSRFVPIFNHSHYVKSL